MQRQLSASFALSVVFAALPATAQVRSLGTPATASAALPPVTETELLQPPSRDDFEAAVAGNSLVFRYGVPIATSIASDAAGRWDVVPAAGVRVWRVRLSSPGARSLGVLFDRFDLPAGGQVFLYDDARSEMLGAYTEANEKPNGMLAIQALRGDALTIEYVAPLGAELPQLRVGEVIHDFRDLFAVLDGGGPIDSGPCLIGINCPEGAAYQTIKRAGILATSGGGLCSASILNNTANDGTPYMLIADHCGDFTNGVFVFNFERPGCTSGTAPMSQSASGSTLLAESAFPVQFPTTTVDSQLYRLNATIPLAYEPLYAGWNRTGALPTGTASMIGHGLGQPRQIAEDANGALHFGNFWSTTWSSGLAQGGNSGSPLFDGDFRVLGTACCVTNFMCGNQATFFGRFDVFFSTRNLDQWLDPLGTGAMTLDAYDPLAAGSPYCVSGASGSTIGVFGSTSVAANDLVLRALEVPAGEFGIFFYGDGQAQFPLGMGSVCVGGALQRLLPAIQAPLNGLLERVLDLGAPPSPAGQITPGSTWNFQGWFRAGASFDFSNAVSVTFTP